jgi:hypothetical protein
MPSQKVLFEGADVDQLYRGGKPSSWEEMLERAAKSSRRRHRISDDEAKELAYAVRLLEARGGDIPDTPRECYLQMLEVLEPIPTPGVYPA